MITNTIKQAIRLHAHSLSPKECCGLILQSGDDIFSYPCKNISSNPETFFEISPLDYLRAQGDNENFIIGIYHSQENSKPSVLDIINAEGHDMYSVVYSWKYNEFFEIDSSISQYSEYLARDFEIGKCDCFSLIRDFYKNEYNISIKDYFRNHSSLKTDRNIILDNYKEEGFSEVIGGPRTGDVILFRVAHFGIYIEKDIFLHHVHYKKSTVDKLSGPWKENVNMFLRHNDRQ